MNRLSRDAWLAIGLLTLLAAVTFTAAFQQTQPPKPPPYASTSAAPDGTLALSRWLTRLGYDVSTQAEDTFEPPGDAALILMLQPNQLVTSDEWSSLDKWVTGGGTLLIAGDSFTAALAISHYHFTLRYLDQPAMALTIQTPLLAAPPIASAANVQADAYLSANRADFVTHLGVAQGPVLVSFRQGKGRVLISAAPFPFSNDGLKDASNPPLVLNLVRSTAQAGGVWFDEWHHGLRASDTVDGPGSWLTTTLGGRSLLYVALVIFVALLLQGRSFGKPLVEPQERTRRAPLEYITAIANLNRRAGHRHALLADYHHRLKRELGRRYRLSPSLDDDEFCRQLATYRPDLNAAELLDLLRRLQRPGSGENELVDLAARASAWLDDRPASPA